MIYAEVKCLQCGLVAWVPARRASGSIEPDGKEFDAAAWDGGSLRCPHLYTGDDSHEILQTREEPDDVSTDYPF